MYSRISAASFLIIALLVSVGNAVRFYLLAGQKRCFTQDLPTGQKINGEVQVYGSKGEMEIDVWITTVPGKVLYHHRAPTHGKLSFETPMIDENEVDRHHEHHRRDMDGGYDDNDEDTYQLCVEHQQPPSLVGTEGLSRVISIKLHDAYSNLVSQHGHQFEQYKGHVVHQQAGEGVPATEQHTTQLAQSMESMDQELRGMVVDLTRLQQKERGLTEHVKETASRVSVLAGISVAITMVTASVQFLYYRSYFKHKKVC